MLETQIGACGTSVKTNVVCASFHYIRLFYIFFLSFAQDSLSALFAHCLYLFSHISDPGPQPFNTES